MGKVTTHMMVSGEGGERHRFSPHQRWSTWSDSSLWPAPLRIIRRPRLAHSRDDDTVELISRADTRSRMPRHRTPARVDSFMSTITNSTVSGAAAQPPRTKRHQVTLIHYLGREWMMMEPPARVLTPPSSKHSLPYPNQDRRTRDSSSTTLVDWIHDRPTSQDSRSRPTSPRLQHREVHSLSATDIAKLPAAAVGRMEDEITQEEGQRHVPYPHRQQQPDLPQADPVPSELGPKPKASILTLSSYDGLRLYQEEKAAWRKASEKNLRSFPPGFQQPSRPSSSHVADEELSRQSSMTLGSTFTTNGAPTQSASTLRPTEDGESVRGEPPKNKFRHFAAEIGFCFTIAMTQFLSEYMVAGFAIQLPRMMKNHNASGLGQFWPASLLTLILSATLLIFARISDMFGGYLPFLFGVVWLGLWSAIAGSTGVGILLDVSRAMQGLSIAAFIPSTFAIIGSIYPEGPRKNFIMGLYTGCAPLGFFVGIWVASALPDTASGWYFWIAAVLSFVAAITAYLTVPHDRTNRKKLSLQMDWWGASLITTGLILVSYALAFEPFANQNDPAKSGWTSIGVIVPLTLGLVCLAVACWVEGWYATCPLLPFDFFRPKSVKALSLACLCFYATYGVWLYESAQFLQNPTVTGKEHGVRGITLALWYTPTAVGGLILCVAGGAMLHRIPIMILLFVSAMAWVAAPLLFALCPTPVNYWANVMPSMVCATLGLDVTYTVAVVFLSSVQPLRYQGLAGAMASILINLAMSFSLSISEIVSEKVSSTAPEIEKELTGFRAAFFYAAASAGLGLVISVLFVRISRSVVQDRSLEKNSKTLRDSSAVQTSWPVAPKAMYEV